MAKPELEHRTGDSSRIEEGRIHRPRRVRRIEQVAWAGYLVGTLGLGVWFVTESFFGLFVAVLGFFVALVGVTARAFAVVGTSLDSSFPPLASPTGSPLRRDSSATARPKIGSWSRSSLRACASASLRRRLMQIAGSSR